MKLRNRLILTFLAVALLSAGILLALSWFTLEVRFEEEFGQRLTGVVDGLMAEIQRMGEQVQQRVQSIVDGEELDRILVGLVKNDLNRRALIPAAGKWMRDRGLDLLTIVDGEGIVLSSGHLPARFGGKDEDCLKRTEGTNGKPAIGRVQVLNQGMITEELSLEVALVKKFGDVRVSVCGGSLIDKRLLERLEMLSGASILVVDAQQRLLLGNSQHQGKVGIKWQERPDVVYRSMPLFDSQSEPSNTFVVAGVSRQELDLAQKRILMISVAAAMVGVLVSFFLGWLISRRVTRPIESLVDATRLVADGEMNVKLPEAHGAEVGELIRAFNQMVSDLGSYHQKLARAERVAAWQDIARRLAHEIKNPLSPIQVSIESMRKAYSLQHPQFSEIFEESTRAIQEEVVALKNIVTEFSQFARLPKPSPHAQPLNPVIESVINLYREQMTRGQLRYEPATDLPPVLVDKEQMGRVLSNLLSNAFAAVADSGSVEVRTGQDSSAVYFLVVDDGKGMSEEVLAQAFTPYFTNRQNGTGLGLAIAQRIVEEHNGLIEIESKPDRGTKVKVSLPKTES